MPDTRCERDRQYAQCTAFLMNFRFLGISAFNWASPPDESLSAASISNHLSMGMQPQQDFQARSHAPAMQASAQRVSEGLIQLFQVVKAPVFRRTYNLAIHQPDTPNARG